MRLCVSHFGSELSDLFPNVCCSLCVATFLSLLLFAVRTYCCEGGTTLVQCFTIHRAAGRFSCVHSGRRIMCAECFCICCRHGLRLKASPRLGSVPCQVLERSCVPSVFAFAVGIV